jgi:hypothetical protein
MTATIAIPETAAEQTGDWDKLVLAYLFANWTLTNPAKGSTPIDQSNPRFVRFRAGFPDYSHAYEINILETESPVQPMNHGWRYWFQTTLLIGIRMERLDPDRPDPQLGFMEREIQRLAMTYITFATQQIPGVKEMNYAGQTRVYNGTDDWAKSDWRSEARINITYEKTVLA